VSPQPIHFPEDPVREDVIAEHCEEAAFLWLQRTRAASGPRHRLVELAELDHRLKAHLEGIKLANERGWETCREVLSLSLPGEAFVVTLAAHELSPTELDAVVEEGSTDPTVVPGLMAAIGWLPIRQARLVIQRWQSSSSSPLRRVALGGAVSHRDVPEPLLSNALSSSDMDLRALGWRAVGRLGRRDLAQHASEALHDSDPLCRFEAAQALVLLGSDVAAETLRSFALKGGFLGEAAAALRACCLSSSEALAWCQELRNTPGMQRAAIIASAVTGSPRLVPSLLELAHQGEHRRIAANALAAITGLDVERDGLEGEPAEGLLPGPTDDPDDEDVSEDPDQELLWPAPEKLTRWWAQQAERFEPGSRYLMGERLAPATLRKVLRAAPQRWRALAAIELMRSSREPLALFATRAPGFRQLAWLTRS
jgi:uncharacterized protein (TIGR02270 family)